MQTLFSLVLALGLLGTGFYLGSHPTLVTQIGLGSLLPADTGASVGTAGTAGGQARQAGTGSAGGSNSAQGGSAQTGNGSTAGAAPIAVPADNAAAGSASAGNAPAGNAPAGNAPAGNAPGGFGQALAVTDDQTVAIQPAGAGGGIFQVSGIVAGTGGQPVILSVAGKIQALAVTVGENVAAGDPLLSLDATAVETAVQAALAQLDSAQRALDTLNADPAKSSTGVAAAERTVADARANLDAAAANLSQTELNAPVAGTVLSIDVQPGQQVAAGTQAVVISTGGGDLALTVQVAGTDSAQVSVNQSVSITMETLPGETFAGTVAEIAQASGATVPVTIHLGSDAAGKVQAGMTAVATFATAQSGASTGWLVPVTALQERNGTAMVFVVRDGQANRVQVIKGATQGDRVVVESPDLQAGDKVVADMAALFQGGGFPRGGAAGTGGADAGGAGTGGNRQTQPQQP